MREILFRGKSTDSGEWVYGSFIPDLLEVLEHVKYMDGFIKPFGKTKEERIMVEVGRKTVGQYTGLTDKNGVKIFEGDIIKCTTCYSYGCYPHDTTVQKEVKFVHGCFSPFEIHVWDCEVVGNIYDNPKLLEAEI